MTTKRMVLFMCSECGNLQYAYPYDTVFCRKFSSHKRWKQLRMQRMEAE